MHRVQVDFGDGSIRQCLAPVAALLNHSATPHILRFGRLDPASRMLHLRTLRWAPHGDACAASWSLMGLSEQGPDCAFHQPVYCHQWPSCSPAQVHRKGWCMGHLMRPSCKEQVTWGGTDLPSFLQALRQGRAGLPVLRRAAQPEAAAVLRVQPARQPPGPGLRDLPGISLLLSTCRAVTLRRLSAGQHCVHESAVAACVHVWYSNCHGGRCRSQASRGHCARLSWGSMRCRWSTTSGAACCPRGCWHARGCCAQMREGCGPCWKGRQTLSKCAGWKLAGACD